MERKSMLIASLAFGLYVICPRMSAMIVLGVIDPKTGVELAIITVFVYAGIRVAPAISNLIF